VHKNRTGGDGAPFLALLLLLLPVPPAEGQHGPLALSLDQAVALAGDSNPGYLATRTDAVVADWEVRQAYGALFPTANASSGVSWQGSGEQRFGGITLGELGAQEQPSYYFSSYSLGMNYSLSGSSLLAPRRAERGRDATLARIRGAETSLVLEVTRRYLQALREDEAAVLARRQVERAEGNLRLAEARESVGAATPLDTRQAEVALGRARVALLQAETGARTARIRLLAEMGMEPDREVELTSRLEITEAELSEGEVEALALLRNPGLQALRAGVEGAEVGIRSARSAYLPSLSLQAGWNGFTRRATDTQLLVDQAGAGAQRSVQQCLTQNELFARLSPPLPPEDCSRFAFTPAQGAAVREANSAFPFDFTRQPPSASLTLSIPIFQGLSRQRNLEAARVERDDARLRVREEELRLRAEVAAGMAAVTTAYETARLEERNQEVAEAQLRLAEEQYRVGSTSFLQLMDAETLKAEADRERLNALFTYREALATLEALVAGPLGR